MHSSPLDLLDMPGLPIQPPHYNLRPRVCDHLCGHVDDVQRRVLEYEGWVCLDQGRGEGLQLAVFWIEEDGVDTFTFPSGWSVGEHGLISVAAK